MKFNLSLILIMFCSLICPAQKADEKAVVAAQQKILKKQILVDELDNQTKNVPFAAVRVSVRTKLAGWLWKNGKDDTGRAEPLAVKAVEELYEKKDEIPDPIFLSQNLLPLLELNAKETAKKLKAKYNIDSGEDFLGAFSLLSKEGGDKIVAGKIKKYIIEKQDLRAITLLMEKLQNKKSPEFLSILFEIVALEETGSSNFTIDSLLWIVSNFIDSTVPNDLKIRFYKIVLDKARNALHSSEADDIREADSLLYAVLPDMAANAPELAAEATGIKAALSAKTSQTIRNSQERNQRMEESADKLGAIIAEAEKTAGKIDKYSLYNRAGLLATREEKFQLAVDLYEKAIENLSEKDFPKPEFRNLYHDQQLKGIVQAALKKDDVDSARYATKKIIGELSKAEALRQTAIYFYDKKDVASALNDYDEALKLAVKADNDKLKFYALFRLIPAAQKIDPSRLSDVTSITAKSIDKLATLNPEDKPETENFKNYVSTIMAINYNLYPVITALAKENKIEAADFANRINRKEVRIVADVALAIDTIEKEEKQIKRK